MAFITFSDQWEVLIDDQGNPLHGRVTFLDYNTSQLKMIYQDSSNIIEAQNPQYTDATGKFINQIFLGAGMYKVKFERYIGSGDMMDTINAEDDMLWFQYKIEEVDGLASSDSGLGESVIVVNTIAELRTVDTDIYTTARVLGYYSRFDNISSRDYVWVAGDTRTDNYGSIIQHTGQSTGRWTMLESEVIDSRYFGVFPSNTETYNSNLTALISWVNSEYCKNKTILFSKGTYSFVQGTFQFEHNIAIEKDVMFDIIGEGTLNLHIKGDYDIKSTTALIKSVDKLATVKIYFDGTVDSVQNKKVISSWYGEFNANNDSPTLIAIGERVAAIYDLYITGAYYHTSGTCEIGNYNVFMEGTLYAMGGTYNFTNCNIKNLRPGMAALNYAMLSVSFMDMFQFNNCVIRSSLFPSFSFQSFLRCQISSNQSRFIFDSSVSFDGAFTDIGTFIFEHEHGTIQSPSIETYVSFNTFKLPNRQVFVGNTWIALKNQDSKLCYFMPDNPTQDEEEMAFYSMIRCALFGNGVADVCNLDPTINNLTSDKQIKSDGDIEILEVKNGTISVTASISLFYINATIFQVRLKDLHIYDSSDDGVTLIECGGTGSITNLILDNITITGQNNTGEAIKTDGGKISYVEVTNSNIKNAWLINETTISSYGIRSVNIHNNRNLQCGFKARNAKPVINSNYIKGNVASSSWEVKCNSSALITGNRFYACDLYLLDNGGGIDHVVTGNQFESSDAKWSRIIVKAETSNSKVVGLTIVGNSFTGVLTSGMPVMIYCEGSFSSDVSSIESGGIRAIYQSIHKCTVRDNTAQDWRMILPSTDGICYLNGLGDGDSASVGTRVNVDGFLRYVWKVNLRPEMFYIPGSTYAIHGDVSVATKANIDGTNDSSNQYWYDTRGIDSQYRSDGKFVFAIHMTKDNDQFATNLTFNFKIYDKVLQYVAI